MGRPRYWNSHTLLHLPRYSMGMGCAPIRSFDLRRAGDSSKGCLFMNFAQGFLLFFFSRRFGAAGQANFSGSVCQAWVFFSGARVFFSLNITEIFSLFVYERSSEERECDVQDNDWVYGKKIRVEILKCLFAPVKLQNRYCKESFTGKSKS